MKLDSTYLPLDVSPPAQNLGQVRVGAFQESSIVAGPGRRAVIWVTGCLRRCPGCIKPEFLSFEEGTWVAVEDLAERILAIHGIDGVTYSGGEPFEQAAALGQLSRRLKRARLSIVSYSGYRHEALLANEARFGPLLHEVDLLIDGEYLEHSGGARLWRGSDNQRLIDLTGKCSVEPAPDTPLQEIQVSLEEGRIRITGFPDKVMEKSLLTSLKKKGILISFHKSELEIELSQ